MLLRQHCALTAVFSCSVMTLSYPRHWLLSPSSSLHQCIFPVKTDLISSLQHSCPLFPLCPVLLSLSVRAGDLFSLMSKLLGHSKNIGHVHKYSPSKMQRAQAELVAQIDSLMQNTELGSPGASLGFQTREDPVLMRDRVHKFHQLEATAKSPGSKLLAAGQGGSCSVWFWSLVLKTSFFFSKCVVQCLSSLI